MMESCFLSPILRSRVPEGTIISCIETTRVNEMMDQLDNPQSNIFSEWQRVPAEAVPFSAAPAELGEQLWPFAQTYHAPLAPIFLSSCVSARSLNQQPAWLVRDGLVPLLHFFRANPSPRGLRTRLYIDPALWAWVPTAWRKYIGVFYLSAPPRKARRRLLITGLLSEIFFSADFQAPFFAQLRRTFARTRRFDEILCFLPAAGAQARRGSSQTYFAQTVLQIGSILGCHIRPMNYKALLAKEDFSEYGLLELNDKNLCADTFTRFLALSRGATPCLDYSFSSARPRGAIALSPYHDLVLAKRPTRQQAKGAAKSFLNEVASLRGALAKIILE